MKPSFISGFGPHKRFGTTVSDLHVLTNGHTPFNDSLPPPTYRLSSYPRSLGHATVVDRRAPRRPRGQGSVLGLEGAILVGILGAIVGGWLLGQLGIFPGAVPIGSILTAFIGAMVLLLLVSVVRRA
jgi:uncharacterized membrane protein YeaQ/YmgE (transglycosylase-associated protein family)